MVRGRHRAQPIFPVEETEVTTRGNPAAGITEEDYRGGGIHTQNPRNVQRGGSEFLSEQESVSVPENSWCL